MELPSEPVMFMFVCQWLLAASWAGRCLQAQEASYRPRRAVGAASPASTPHTRVRLGRLGV